MQKLKKIIVFDLDGTLLYRSHERLKNKKHVAHAYSRYFYLRPFLNAISSFITDHEDIFEPVLWSRMMPFNAKYSLQLLNSLGIAFQKVYDQNDCEGEQKKKKDLKRISKYHGTPIEDILLVDDTADKRVQEQNFLHVKPFEGQDETDTQLIQILPELDKFLGCEKNCIAKNLKLINLQIKYPIKIEKKQEKMVPKIKEESEVKINNDLKVVVFDLNKTLLIKSKEAKENLNPDGKVSGQFVFLRPYIKLINQFLLEHNKNGNLIAAGWTTMQGTKRANQYLSLFHDFDLHLNGIFNQAHCFNEKSKDLKVVCEKYGALLENAILIDDSAYKRVEEQNFIQIKRYEGDHEDQEIYTVLEKLDKFFNCTENCLIKKIAKKIVVLSFYKKNQKIVPIEKKPQKQQPKFKEKKEVLDFGVNLYVNKKDKIKNLVFDINETLLFRTEEPIKNLDHIAKFKRYFIYKRPGLDLLAQFLKKHHFNIYLWTTITKRNSEIFFQILKEQNFLITELYTQESMNSGKKDLGLIAKKQNKEINEFLLIDDNINKRHENQNFIQICPFNERNFKTNGIIELIKGLEKIINCEK